MFSCTCTHTRHATLWLSWGGVGWGGVGQWRSCQLAHTRHATLLLCSLALAHTHTSCYVRAILGWGWVGWGGAMTFMSTCTHTHTSCYVIVMFSCTCTHTRHATLWLSWGGVGWGNDVHVNLHTHTSCYVIVMFSCTCTRLLRVCLISKLQASWKKIPRAHDRAPLFLQMETVLGNHMPKVWKSNMPKCLIKTKNGPNKCEEPPVFSCPLWQGRKSLTDGGKAWKIIFPKAFQDNTKEHPELEKFVLGYCWRKSLGPLTPHRFLEELCKAVKAMKRFWEEGKKCCIPKKHELMSKDEVVLEIFKTLFFTSTWEKITFRCSENDIFVDEKLLKPYGRLWVGNLVVSS